MINLFPNDLFCNNDKVDETSPASNDDHTSGDNEDTKDEILMMGITT